MVDTNTINEKKTEPYLVAGVLFIIALTLSHANRLRFYFNNDTYWNVGNVIDSFFVTILELGILIFLSFSLYKSKLMNNRKKFILAFVIFLIFIFRLVVNISRFRVDFMFILYREFGYGYYTQLYMIFISLISLSACLLFCLLLINKNTGVAIITCEILLFIIGVINIITGVYILPEYHRPFIDFSLSINSFISNSSELILNVSYIIFVYTYIINEFPDKTKYNESGIALDLLKPTSIGKCIILSILTFGIYYLIWQYSLCKKTRLLNNENKQSLGEFLCLLFVPFYIYYWIYTRSKKIHTAAAVKGIMANDNAVISLVLSLLGLFIVSFTIMQSELNAIALKLSSGNNAGAAFNNYNNSYAAPSIPYQQPQQVSYPIPPAKPVINPVINTVPETKQREAQAQPISDFQKISELAKLRDLGSITEEEFAQKKAEILSRL